MNDEMDEIESDTKKRVPFTVMEREFLIKLVRKFPILENKNTNAQNILKKKNAWATLANTFNSQSFTSKRSEFQLKRCWENMKSARKKELAIERINTTKTGGGPSTQPPPSPNMIDAVCPHIDLCVPDVIDSDHLPHLSKDYNIEDENTEDLCVRRPGSKNEIYQPKSKENDLQEPSKKLKKIHTECEARVARLLQCMQQEQELHELRIEKEKIIIEKEKILLIKTTEELQYQRAMHKSKPYE